MTDQDGTNNRSRHAEVDDIQNTDNDFWLGLHMGCIELYEYFQEKHEEGLVTDEEMDALVLDRLTEEERELAKLILIETDTECLKELLASPLCCPKVIDYTQTRFKVEDPDTAEMERGGDSSLLRAARMLQVDKVRLLLEAGANPNVNDFFDNSALHGLLDWRTAEEDEVQEIIQLLMEYGYDATSVNAEKKKTAFEIRVPRESQEEDDCFGEGIYEAFDVVSWNEIEEAILTETSSDEDDQKIIQIVRRLVDLGWGPGADKNAVNGKEKRENGGCGIRDRLQLVNQVSAPCNEKTLYLYYWDGRDGPGFEGWWVADGLGSNGYFFCNIGRNDTPPEAGNWVFYSVMDPEGGFRPVYEDGEVEEVESTENISVVGYQLDYPRSRWHGQVFNLTQQMHHGKPVYAKGQFSSKLEDRCNLLVDKVLLPLLHLAAQQCLEDTDEAPCKSFARYLLASCVALACQEKVIVASEQGLQLLEEVLRDCYVEVGPSLDSSCVPFKTMDHQYEESKKMKHYHIQGGMDCMEYTGDAFLLKSVVALCREGYTLAEICHAFSALGWTNKESYRSGVYALWRIKVAERCNQNLVQAVEARIAQKDDENKEEGGMKARIHKPYRILENRSDCHDRILRERNYDLGCVTDSTRISLECPTPDDLIHCFKALAEANIEEHGFEVVPIKSGFSSENVNPRGGYRDVKLNLRVRGSQGGHDSIAEVELLLKKFLDVKKHMHLLNEVVRGSHF